MTSSPVFGLFLFCYLFIFYLFSFTSLFYIYFQLAGTVLNLLSLYIVCVISLEFVDGSWRDLSQWHLSLLITVTWFQSSVFCVTVKPHCSSTTYCPTSHQVNRTNARRYTFTFSQPTLRRFTSTSDATSAFTVACRIITPSMALHMMDTLMYCTSMVDNRRRRYCILLIASLTEWHRQMLSQRVVDWLSRV